MLLNTDKSLYASLFDFVEPWKIDILDYLNENYMCDLSMEEIEESGFANYYVDHTVGVWPMAAGGIPFNSCEFQSKGDAITDLFENMAAEQKARST